MPEKREEVVLRACLSAYVVLGLIFGFLTLMTGIAAHAQNNMLLPFLVCAVAWFFSIVWLVSFRVGVSTNSLSYRSLFGGNRVLRLADIRSIIRESGVRQYGDRFRPFVRLVVTTVSDGQRIDINLKVFSTRDIQMLIQGLKANCIAIGHSDAGSKL